MFDKILNMILIYEDPVFLWILRCESFKQIHCQTCTFKRCEQFSQNNSIIGVWESTKYSSVKCVQNQHKVDQTDVFIVTFEQTQYIQHIQHIRWCEKYPNA